MYLSNTTLFDVRDMYRICYIKNNYMFRPLRKAIFRLRNEKNLINSYTRLMWTVNTGEARGRGELCTRSRIGSVRWAVWVHGAVLSYAVSL